MKARRVPYALGGPVLIVAIEDDGFERLRPMVEETLPEIAVPIEHVRASSLADPDTEAHFHFAVCVHSRPRCVRHFHTARVETYEQAPKGAIRRNGHQVWPEAPVATGRPSSGVEGELVQGEDAALLFCSPPHMRITVTGPILFLFRQPQLRAGEALPEWLAEARAILPRPRPS